MEEATVMQQSNHEETPTSKEYTDSGSKSHLNPDVFKRFVRHVCVAAKKQKDRDVSKYMLKQQIQNVKNASLSQNPKRWLIEDELKRLEYKIIDVLAKEAELLSIGKKDTVIISELRERIKKLEAELSEAKRAKEIEVRENQRRIEALARAMRGIKGKVEIISTKKRH
jgi:hypothetical protein